MASFFDWLTGYRAKLSGRDDERSQANPPGWEPDVGPRVNQKSVMGLAAAWACVRLRSRVVGSLPCTIIGKDAGGSREEMPDHWLYALLHDSPNADQTPYEFWSNQVACLDLWGNGYSEKTLGALGRTTALTPLSPDRVTVRRNLSGEREYWIHDRGQDEALPEEKVFHLRSLTLGGDVGLSAVAAGCQSLGGAIAAELTAASILSGGLQIAGFMETGSTSLKPEQRADLAAIFNAFTGSSKAGRIMPLEKDFKFQPVRMNPAEAQLLETRARSVEEVCRWFDGTPPILIGHATPGQTMFGTGVEHTFLGWLTMGLNPLLTNIQQAARKQLLPAPERKLIKVEFNREGLLAADSQGRAALYNSALQNGWMDRDEVRQKENLNSRPGGKTLTVQSNLVPLDQLGKALPRATQPAPGDPI